MQQPVADPYAEPHHWSKSAQCTVSLAALRPVICVWISGCLGICFWLPPGFQTHENSVSDITLRDGNLVKLSPKAAGPENDKTMAERLRICKNKKGIFSIFFGLHVKPEGKKCFLQSLLSPQFGSVSEAKMTDDLKQWQCLNWHRQICINPDTTARLNGCSCSQVTALFIIYFLQ